MTVGILLVGLLGFSHRKKFINSCQRYEETALQRRLWNNQESMPCLAPMPKWPLTNMWNELYCHILVKSFQVCTVLLWHHIPVAPERLFTWHLRLRWLAQNNMHPELNTYLHRWHNSNRIIPASHAPAAAIKINANNELRFPHTWRELQVSLTPLVKKQQQSIISHLFPPYSVNVQNSSQFYNEVGKGSR